MQLTAFLAESVAVAEGKLFAQAAGWNTFHTERLPAVIPRIGIGVILHPDTIARGTPVSVTVRLLDGAGNGCHLVSAAVEGGSPPIDTERLEIDFTIDDDDAPLVVLAITMDNLVLPGAEDYRFVVSVDALAQTRLPLRVVPA